MFDGRTVHCVYCGLAALRRTFHDVTNSVLFMLEITLQLEYVVWESLFINRLGKVGLITSE